MRVFTVLQINVRSRTIIDLTFICKSPDSRISISDFSIYFEVFTKYLAILSTFLEISSAFFESFSKDT